MFLLFLCLGIANVNAQVRIGGNAAPNGAAVLDLNATDAATGTKGLALPRVRLDSATMQITPGVPNLAGMLIYTAATSTMPAGIYSWISGSWVRASLPVTTPADSGYLLMSNGSTWVKHNGGLAELAVLDTPRVLSPPTPVTWVKSVDTMVRTLNAGRIRSRMHITGLQELDRCTIYGPVRLIITSTGADSNLYFTALSAAPSPVDSNLRRVVCYRPSA